MFCTHYQCRLELAQALAAIAVGQCAEARERVDAFVSACDLIGAYVECRFDLVDRLAHILLHREPRT